MKIGVLGSGIMGNGIAQVFAMSGYNVVLTDLKKEALHQARIDMEQSLTKISKKKENNIKPSDVLQSVVFTTDKEQLADSDIVIEAIIENMKAKTSVFRELDEICDSKTILASNTSSLAITEIAAATNRPEKVCGIHFFNPVPLMKLVEIISAEQTSNEIVDRISKVIESVNKESIQVKDTPLFVVNRILVPMICEAIFVFEEGIATADDIDKGMKLGAGHPMGPLKLADIIGLDTLLYVQKMLFQETGDSKYRVPKLLKKMVRAGNFGQKTGKGFYDYP
ncbi:3-hydroxyacyl-CoA dehydrogenase family protein [Salinibacillus xinjiangensis]|uniref:3-hydroxybutyryl-CoA dehydrogenase n=1 Tax=Salinibacillus xinjiangensis TaxID=1229268 RepID=A0A6G1X1S7_9BACI|nr:3-hydroxyacyl-CoA dehydrogenase NAD-binding domain-containing protein [Salinibacillus xinjiangensis]MRG84892.1 3-hydroxybutyryl-CoA dehydrogenase [Salinibacillus xinjiangensis]